MTRRPSTNPTRRPRGSVITKWSPLDPGASSWIVSMGMAATRAVGAEVVVVEVAVTPDVVVGVDVVTVEAVGDDVVGVEVNDDDAVTVEVVVDVAVVDRAVVVEDVVDEDVPGEGMLEDVVDVVVTDEDEVDEQNGQGCTPRPGRVGSRNKEWVVALPLYRLPGSFGDVAVS